MIGFVYGCLLSLSAMLFGYIITTILIQEEKSEQLKQTDQCKTPKLW